jgi:crotonobetainyl-CoA:carnitine CoA-transferase CaiB-like acyl-CoA transferase
MIIDSPLDGLLVVSLEQAVAAPYCTSRLADAGARVIKVERPDGDFARVYDHVVKGQSAYFVWLNRGKESLTADIKNADDRDLLLRIIASADVFVQNLAPGAAERVGLGSEQLRRDNPRLITVDISGYGESGPYRDMKAYDLLVQSESGLASITGAAAEPGRVGVSICDISCGMYAHAAVLEALISRSISGKGKGIKVSLFDSIADWMTVPLLHQNYGGQAPHRVGLNHPSIAPYGAYTCKDQHEIVLAIQNEREWLDFCKVVLEKPEIATDPRFDSNVNRCEHRQALDSEINAVFCVCGREQVISRLQTGNIAFGVLNSVAEFSTHPQLRKVHLDTPGGMVKVVAPPAEFSDGARSVGGVPLLGEHNEAIRQEFQ